MTEKVRFEVWVDDNSEILEFTEDETEEEIEIACLEACETMISNNVDSGWRKLEPGEKGRGK